MTGTSSTSDDLRVTVELGITLPFADHGFVKPMIKLEGLNPAGDVEQQISDGLATAVRAFTRVDEELEVIITQLLSPVAGKPGIRDRVETLERGLETLRASNRKLIERLRDRGILDAAAAATRGRADAAGSS